jgi:hypothetical protein
MIETEKIILSKRLDSESVMRTLTKKRFFIREQDTDVVEKKLFYHTFWHICVRTVIKQMLRGDKVYERCVLVDGIEGSAGFSPALPDYSPFDDSIDNDVIVPKIKREAAIEKAKATIKDLILRKVFLLKDLDFVIKSVKLVHSPYWRLTLRTTKGLMETLTVDSVSGREDRRVGYYYQKYNL